jgi:hypothetical protein
MIIPPRGIKMAAELSDCSAALFNRLPALTLKAACLQNCKDKKCEN